MDTDTPPTIPADEPATGPAFRATHGSEEWSRAEIDAYEELAYIHAYSTAA